MAKQTKNELVEAARLAAERAQRDAEIDNTPPPAYNPAPLSLVQRLRKLADEIEGTERLFINNIEMNKGDLANAKTASDTYRVCENLERLARNNTYLILKIKADLSVVGEHTDADITFDYSKEISALLAKANLKSDYLDTVEGN